MRTTKLVTTMGVLLLIAWGLAPTASAHTATGSHDLATFFMEDLDGQIQSVQTGGCTSHAVSGSGAEVSTPYDLQDGPDHRTEDDFEDNNDYRWETEVRMDINDGASNWFSKWMWPDWNTNEYRDGSLSIDASSGCGLYSLQIAGESYEQIYFGGSWENTGTFKIIDGDLYSGIEIARV